ncbi:SagB/ThcOx family dehydrogenase [Archangium lansingense]|uniref:SagB/ThcOx family dehydrogenase n=1 Tax=Archangium lansingense TaxID=2995310 RepID=A0ABT4ANX8_9BACT|nr:SagB/ThcOx family dehydrogenase [Archangium lansinium]MCY1083397.1 SagB/ThcOx family dehydrogenase [Archangium lansinium]
MKPRVRHILQEWEQSQQRREAPPSLLFHENSKLTRPGLDELGRRIGRIMSEGLTKELARSWKCYPGHPQVELPRANLVLERGLQEVIVGRRSLRAFDPHRPVTLQELANLLQLSYGITGRLEDSGGTQYLRAIPSAGALYPLELYLMVQRVQGLDPGLYHYRVAHHALEALELADQSESMQRMEREWGMGSAPAFYLVVSALFARTMIKYRERGYRFILMEAGMLGQCATLLAECQQLHSCMMGGWLDDELNGLLGLDGSSESVVHVMCFGRAPREDAHG